MKKLAGLIILIIVFYAVYNDLRTGTLPSASIQKVETVEKIKKERKSETKTIPFFEHEVKPGDTVLSVLESNSKSSLDVPVSRAVEDFKLLNDGADPQKIKFGKTYKFPDYGSSN